MLPVKKKRRHGAKRDKPPALVVRNQAFVDAICRGLNATEAIVAAGYTGTTAKDAGYRTMRDPAVRAAIDKRRGDAMAEAGITHYMILRELGRLAFLDPRKLLDDKGCVRPPDEWDDDTAAAVAGLEIEQLFIGAGKDREYVGDRWKLKLINKREALTELAAIAKLKQDSSAPVSPTGPGLQVIVQQVVQQGERRTVVGSQVIVDLPGPG